MLWMELRAGRAGRRFITSAPSLGISPRLVDPRHSVRTPTELHITQEGVPAVIPAKACYLGWQESLTLLAQLVDPEIPVQP
jgi:hypothetical protein